jgi:hypothetical protein
MSCLMCGVLRPRNLCSYGTPDLMPGLRPAMQSSAMHSDLYQSTCSATYCWTAATESTSRPATLKRQPLQETPSKHSD